MGRPELDLGVLGRDAGTEVHYGGTAS